MGKGTETDRGRKGNRPHRSSRKRRPESKASDLMSRVDQSLSASITIRQARERMEQTGAGFLPLAHRGRIVGAVSRETIDGALHHGLGDARVHDVASADVPVLSPETPLSEIRRLFQERNLGFVLVGRNRRNFDGIISRTLLFEHLARIGAMQDGRRLRLESAMEKRLPQRILQILHASRQVAGEDNLRPFLVGGMVRDLLLKRENTDVDLVIEGDGPGFARRLRDQLGGEVREYPKFGTAVLVLPDGFKVDVASSRLESYAAPAALPQVRSGEIHHDLFRRDFTINALAVELAPKPYGRLLDLFGGHRDLEEGTIRVLHSLSFIEDPTRALRAVRFANRLSFRISPETATYIRVAVRKKVFRQLSGERLLRELIFLLMEHRPVASLKMLSQLGLLTAVHPALGLTSRRLGMVTRVEKILNWYDALPRPLEPLLRWQVYLLALTDGLERRRLESVLKRLSIQGRPNDFFLSAGRVCQRLESSFGAVRIDRARIFSVCSPLRPEVLLFAAAKTARKSVRRHLTNYLTQLVGTRLEISGRDLQEMGLQPGPVYSQILREVLRTKLRGEISGRKEELAFAEQLSKKHLPAG